MKLPEWLRIVDYPDDQCPECGWSDLVPTAVVVRSRRGRTRIVGRVVRCAKCVHEFCVGPGGAYEPRPRSSLPGLAQEPDRRGNRQEQPRQLRDRDQPWDKG